MSTKLKRVESTVDVRGIVGRKVRSLRIEAGLSQQAIADKMGIYRTYVSRLECGSANPTITVEPVRNFVCEA
jgi:DNA-binding XRE family transcriptional regulator